MGFLKDGNARLMETSCLSLAIQKSFKFTGVPGNSETGSVAVGVLPIFTLTSLRPMSDETVSVNCFS